MTEVKEALNTLCRALNEDKSEGSYYYSWQDNIAMAFKDEYNKVVDRHLLMGSSYHPFQPNINDIANQAAKNFLDTLTGPVEPIVP